MEVRSSEGLGRVSAQLIVVLPVRQDSAEPPASCFVKPLGSRVGIRAQPDGLYSLGEEPLDHDVVEPSPMTFPFVVWVDKQGPDILRLSVPDSEGDNFVGLDNDPPTSCDLDLRYVVLLADRTGRKPVLPDSKPDAMHSRDVSAQSLAKDGVHFSRPNVGVDRHAAALRREAYAHQHALRRNAAASSNDLLGRMLLTRSSPPKDVVLPLLAG